MKALLMTISVTALLAIAPLSIAQSAGKKVNERLDIPSSAQVTVDNLRGKVKVRSHDSNTAEVTGTLDEEATDFIFELRGNTLVIKVEMPRNSNSYNWSGSGGSDLVINLPKQVALNLSGVSMDADVAGLAGGADIKLVSGNILANRLSGNVRLNTVSGDITSRKLGERGSDIRFETVSGDIDDADADSNGISYQSVSGDIIAIATAEYIQVQSVSGDIELDLGTVSKLSLKTVSGDTSATLALLEGGLIEAQGVSGDLTLAFTEEPDAQFELGVNAGGDITNRLSSDKAEKAKYGPSKTLNFRLGNGSASVTVDTVSGDITLNRD